ncbi:MAG: hypothetical protein LWW82_11345, partial [Comamonadaceae bacterium]|nr:hypothetical protein [Comamonadaceae bacterium]
MAPAAPRYAVGIDLGTSHSALAYVPLQAAAADIALLPIAQRSSASEVQALALLPSARYQGAEGELGPHWDQPWPALGASAAHPAATGQWAR